MTEEASILSTRLSTKVTVLLEVLISSLEVSLKVSVLPELLIDSADCSVALSTSILNPLEAFAETDN